MNEKIEILLILLLCCLVSCTSEDALQNTASNSSSTTRIGVIPQPKKVSKKSNSSVDLSQGIYVVPAMHNSQAVSRPLNRFINQMTQLDISTSNPDGVHVSVELDSDDLIQLDESTNEGYSLDITTNGILIEASNYFGLNHALSTLAQLIYQHSSDNTLTTVSIQDEPRYPWRGLMIDVSRHFISKKVILENLDAMALVKMNVLHLHLSDDQGWRLESKLFPRLHTVGSDGKYYTHEDIKEIVAYALERGIRVIPEINMPAHVTSWLVAYPELATVKGTYELMKSYGIHKNLLDPTNDNTYKFIQGILTELSALFPDEIIHIGGNELLLEQWKDSPSVQQFMSENDLVDLGQLQAYFLLRVQQITKKLGKTMMAWHESMRPELDQSKTAIQISEGNQWTQQAANLGFKTIHSSGWMLDHKLPAKDLYTADPTGTYRNKPVEIDSNNWNAWNINANLGEEKRLASILLFGQPGNQRGIIQLSNKTRVLDEVVLDTRAFTFHSDSDISGVLNRSNEDQVVGTMIINGLKIQVNGNKVGGHDMPGGVDLPKINQDGHLRSINNTNIVGGEACMWTEWADDNNLNSRIWPRAAVVAEKLWAHQSEAASASEFYSEYLSFIPFLRNSGMNYGKVQEDFVIEIAEGVSRGDVHTFLDALEEVKYYGRFATNLNHNISTPLNNVADIVAPESMTANRFHMWVEELEKIGANKALKAQITDQLDTWIPLYKNLSPIFKTEARIKSQEVLALSLSDLSKIAKHSMESGILSDEESEYYDRLKLNAQREIEGVYLAPARDLIRLIDRFRTEI